MLSVRQIREKAGAKTGSLHSLNSSNTPAIFALVLNAGIQGDLVASGGGGIAVVRLADLFHAGDGVGAGSKLGCQDDCVALAQRMNLPEIRAGTSVV